MAIPRFFVSNTQNQAQQTVNLIDNRMRALFQSKGYTIRDGTIVAKRADGSDSPFGGYTTWDIPKVRTDGKWVVLHPENYPLNFGDGTDKGVTVDNLVQGINDPVETYEAWWFPEEPLGP